MERPTSVREEETSPNKGTFCRSLETGSCLSHVWGRVTPVLGVRDTLERHCCHCECGLCRCNAEMVPDHKYGRGRVSDSRAHSHCSQVPSPPSLPASSRSHHPASTGLLQWQPASPRAHYCLRGSKSPRDRMARNPHACSPMCLLDMSPALCARGQGLALQPSPAAPLLPRVNRTQQARRLQSREGFWLTLAGKQRWRRSAQPPKRGAGGQSAPQAWVEVDPEETPPPREPTCYCRNSQRNSCLG